MSKPTRRLKNEQLLHAVTKGKGDAAKPLPETIQLVRSQVYALNALANDEQRLTRQLQEIQQSLQQTQSARAEVLEEITKASGVAAADIAANYLFDGKQLVKPAPPE